MENSPRNIRRYTKIFTVYSETSTVYKINDVYSARSAITFTEAVLGGKSDFSSRFDALLMSYSSSAV